VVYVESQERRRDGAKRLLAWWCRALRDGAGRVRGELSTARDVTDIRQQERELRERNEELARFTYTVSHDLRSPLVTIRTFLGYLEKDMARPDAGRVEQDLGYIRGAADKMARLLDELLELSRVGRQPHPPEDVPLQAVVDEALALVAGRIAQRGVRVETTPDPIVLRGDRVRLVEVFQNLLDNAVKFIGDQAAPRIEVGAEDRDGEVVLFVRDNGDGVDPRHQARLFGLFEKLHPGTEGSGIGLAMVRRIVELHGGRAWIESAGSGQGATVLLTLAGTRRA
jgi:signal transduction histidine kinase